MCGIVGIVHRDRDRPVSPALIDTMCTAIRHRGPDDVGTFVRGAVGLGMRRLSIIDLAGGRQPIFNEDGSKVIVFNGEIYNYKDLSRDLVRRGHTFQTHSDTETILHLYEERGAECVEALRGMFAFAIWDHAAGTLTLARDRFGIKPLYVITADWGIAFASELKALVAAGLTSRTLDWDALDSFFQMGYVMAPRTPFLDVRKLEAGHTLTWHPDRSPVERRYWDVPAERRPAPARAEERVLEWLDDSVAAHLVSDVPVAAFLSGGLDSSAVVASMARQGPPPHVFTARYHGSGAAAADETPLARLLAERYGARLTVVDVRPAITDLLEPIVRAMDEPHADDSAVPTWLISQAVGAEYKVALTGIGGDELFAGYRRHIGHLLGSRYRMVPAPARRALAALARGLREPEDGGLAVSRVKRFLASAEGAPQRRLLEYVSRMADGERTALYHPDIRRSIGGTASRDRFDALYDAGHRPAGLNAGLYLDVKTFLADDILALSDRLSMAHSLEIRVPLVDHVLAERIFPLPDRAKVGLLGRGKHLLREALRPRLPAEHFRAPKRGFVGPTAAWLRNELREMLLDELAPDRLARLGVFDGATVARLLDEHFDRRHNWEGVLWGLLLFSTWHRVFVDDAGERPPVPGAMV
jgi:asparagine synthase (glutamine-hydrolysing)